MNLFNLTSTQNLIVLGFLLINDITHTFQSIEPVIWMRWTHEDRRMECKQWFVWFFIYPDISDAFQKIWGTRKCSQTAVHLILISFLMYNLQWGIFLRFLNSVIWPSLFNLTRWIYHPVGFFSIRLFEISVGLSDLTIWKPSGPFGVVVNHTQQNRFSRMDN